MLSIAGKRRSPFIGAVLLLGGIVLLLQISQQLIVINTDGGKTGDYVTVNCLRLQNSIDDLQIRRHDDQLPIVNRTPGYFYYDDKYISLQNNVYIDEYHLHYCKMDKNMGSTMQAVLCYIDNPNKMHKFFFDQEWGPGLGDTQCGISTSYGELRERFLIAASSADFFNSTNAIRHFAIVRHPISRLISAFLNICPPQPKIDLCFNCGRNLDCFIPKLYRHLRAHAEHFALERWYREWHFYPQSWYCDFDRRLDDYQLIRYGRNPHFVDELVGLFRDSGVNASLIADVEHILKRKTVKHATYGLAPKYLKKLRASKLLMEYVYKMYYLDFVWFGYDLFDDASPAV